MLSKEKLRVCVITHSVVHWESVGRAFVICLLLFGFLNFLYLREHSLNCDEGSGE